ncbi:N-acetyltransferase [Magnetovibrio sp.]|uniref:GNAT family N-acetyltransferase n=1 Tax=Magnetovibrio sp. TaxID=2024836 RepID=UPI002F940918
MRIREEQPDDFEGIRAVNDAAFGGTDESELIDRLREADLVITALVAEEYGEIVGHILFSELEVTSDDHKRSIRAAALAPMAVAPTHQRLGIGSELVRQGLEKCRENGIEAVVVVGHERFYPRFGFSAQIAECLKSPFSGPFSMVLTLKQGVFDDFSGFVIYPDAFCLDI